MSDVWSTVRSAFTDTVDFIKEQSARVPGSPTQQALVVGVTCGALTYLLMKRHENLPPGPYPLPLLGNILALSGATPGYKKLKEWSVKYGPVITVYLGPLRCITLNRVDVIREALVQRGGDFAGRPRLYSMGMFSEGYRNILFADDSLSWKLHRKIATKALNHYMRGQHLEKVVHEVVAMVADKMCEEKGAFDPHPYNSLLVFHLIYTLCFGKVKAFDDPKLQRLIDLFDFFTKELGNGFWEDVIPPLRLFPTRKFQRFQESLREFLDGIYAEVDEHRARFSPDNVRDMVDSILLAQVEAQKEESAEVMAMFTDTHIGQTISDIFGGGVDTSRLTMDWIVVLMAAHPKVS